MSDSPDDIPSFEELATDPEIAPLLEFEPVPRKIVVEGGWSPERQREFIARLAVHGSANKACNEMGMHRTGMSKLEHAPAAKSFRAAWRGAVELARRRRAEQAEKEFVRPDDKLPTVDHRRKHVPAPDPSADGAPHYVPGIPADLQERDYREALDYERRAQLRWDESHRRVRDKFFYCRRMYLMTIADDPERRAAWELLCGPADWDAARHLKQQPDEDREPVHLEELETASWQVPLKTGFCISITDAGRSLAANTLERLEESIRRNDPRSPTFEAPHIKPSPLAGEGADDGETPE